MPKEAKGDSTPPIPLRLKEFREAMGWSQDELAERMGWSNATVARIEGGKQNWTPPFLIRAAEVFGVEFTDLIQAPPGSAFAMWQSSPPEHRAIIMRTLKSLKE